MAKDKGGREAKTPKADHNKKTKGQTPAQGAGSVDAINHKGASKGK